MTSYPEPFSDKLMVPFRELAQAGLYLFYMEILDTLVALPFL